LPVANRIQPEGSKNHTMVPTVASFESPSMAVGCVAGQPGRKTKKENKKGLRSPSSLVLRQVSEN
jgi:hypothetical protein